MIGKTFSHYTIVEELGRGGMGIVYRAEDTDLKRDVALKFLPADLDRTPGARERFVHEARAAASLSHPNICTIHEIGEYEGSPFISMEFVDGESLREKIDAGLIEMDDVVDIAIETAEGLAAAHEKGIVHRDIKSSNIMVTGKGKPMIMDFGLARSAERTQLTTDGTTLGTAAYMSPEQAQGQAADHRSDIWSLGVVLYEMITGGKPFQGDYEHAVVYSIIHTEPDPPAAVRADITPEIDRIVSRCLQKDPADRYQTASELVSDLKRFQRQVSSGQWSGRVEEAKTRGKDRRRFPKPMSRGLWLLLFCIPAVAFLIARVIVPHYFSPEVYDPEPERKRLAVLPFENLGPPGEEYFADGITEELIARLAKVEDLGVIARTSVMRYKDTDMSIDEIGAELEVDYILEGTVRWQKLSNADSRVRITPQLIRVSDETHLWAEVYQRDMTDIFLVQEEIAGRVASSLGTALQGDGSKGVLAPVPTENTDAYHAYLEGRFWWNKRSQEGFDRAIEFFDKAIRVDPGYALAYAAKAECYAMFAIHLARPAEYNETARVAASRALELDDSLPEAYSALGWVSFVYDYDFPEAERLFLKAIDLDPRYATAYNWYGVLLSCVGRDDEAIEMMTRARQLDPASMIINRDLGCVLSWAGKLDEAQSQLEKTLAMDPDFTPALAHLGRIFAVKGMLTEAFAVFDRLRAIDSEYFNLDMMTSYAHAKAGNREESRRILDGLLALADTQKGNAFEIAVLYGALNENDSAFEWFDRALKNREFTMVLLDATIMIDELREDPRYDELKKRIGL